MNVNKKTNLEKYQFSKFVQLYVFIDNEQKIKQNIYLRDWSLVFLFSFRYLYKYLKGVDTYGIQRNNPFYNCNYYTRNFTN